MLLQRVITALVLLAILLPALFYPSVTPFALVVLVFMAAGAWEWGRLNGRGNAAALGLSAVCLALCAGSWWAGWLDRPLPLLWTLGGGLWVACTAWGCCAPVCLAGRSFPRLCASFWVCWRCGWPGLPWCRHASSVSISCCRCSPWCGWLTSLRILPAGLLACALPATSWHPPSALAKAGRVWGGLGGVVPGRGLGCG